MAKKLETMQQAHGKKEDLEEKDLGKLFSEDSVNPFGSITLEEFESSLGTMTLHDLKGLAVKAGLSVYGDTYFLKERLVKAFKRERAIRSTTGPVKQSIPNVDPDKLKKLDEQMDL